MRIYLRLRMRLRLLWVARTRRGGDGPRTPLGKLSGSGVVCLQIHKLAYAYTRILVTSVNKYLRDTYIMDMRMHARDHDSKFQNIV